MADVIKSPCHLTTYPLLAEPQHYAQYQDPDFFQSPNPLDHSEPLYEELEPENGDSAQQDSSRFFSKELAYRNTSHLNRNGSTQRSGRSASLNRTPGYPEFSASGTQYRSRTPSGSVQRERSPRPPFYRGRCPPEVPPFSEPTDLEKNIQIPDFYNQSPQYYCNTYSSNGSGRRSATRPDTRNGTAKLSRNNSLQH